MNLINGADISFYYLTTKSDVNKLISIIKENKLDIIALDTETYALKKYRDKASALDPHTSKIRLTF